MTTVDDNPFATAAPGQSTPVPPPSAAQAANAFGAPAGAPVDPFAAPAEGGGLGPKLRDLVGRVVALRKTEVSMRPGYQAKPDDPLVKTFTCHLVVFTGGMITTTPGGDDINPITAQAVELGMPVMMFRDRHFSQPGVINRFASNTVIIGKVGRLAGNKKAAETLNTPEKVEAWLATNPPDEVRKSAKIFWTILDEVTPEERAEAVRWVNSSEGKSFLE